MQLRLARLCLDCEEVHDQLHCPVCASDHFTYLSRWVPVPERRARRRPEPPPPAELDVYRQMINPPARKPSLLGRTLMGLGAAGLVGLVLGGQRARARKGETAPEEPEDE